MFGLSVDTLRNIREVFARFPSIEKVLLYGSRAKGNYKTGSDIDITLIGKNLNLNSTISLLRDALDQLYLPYTFDISIFNQLDEPAFIDHILRVGKTFYERESGVMEGWSVSTLGKLCQIELGRTPSRSNPNFWDTNKVTDNVWLSIADLPQTFNARVFESKEHISDEALAKSKMVLEGTLLVSFKLTLGRLAFAGRNLYTNEAIASLTILDEKEITKEYLYWYLTYFDWDKAAKGEEKIKGKTLNKKKLNVLPVVIPPLSEQKKIVATLDKAFAAIDTATANTKKNLADARKLFESYSHEAFAIQISAWPQRPLGDVCKNLDKKRVPITKAKREPGEVPYYGASGVVDYVAYHLFDEDLLLVSEDGANLLARTYPIAFSISGRSWVNNHAHVLRFETREHQRFTEHYLNSISLKPFVSGMAQPKLNQAKLNSILIPWSENAVDVGKVVRSVEAADSYSSALTIQYNQKLARFAELKQSLLHQAFTGELTADPKTADRTLSEASV